MDRQPKKLTLSRETVCALDDAALAQVVGGQPTNGVVCVDVDSVVCQSGVCRSVVCQSGALCNSAVCNSGILCQ